MSTVDRELRSASLFNIKTLTSFQELHPFFNALSTQHVVTQHSSSPLTTNNGGILLSTDSITASNGCIGIDLENVSF